MVAQDENRDAVLEPPRFTLRGLWIVITALGCLFGVMTAVGALSSAALVFFLALVAAHVMGNSLGTRLRDRSSRRGAAEKRADSQSLPQSTRQVIPPGRLAQRAQLKGVEFFMTLVGSTAGGSLGGIGSA